MESSAAQDYALVSETAFFDGRTVSVFDNVFDLYGILDEKGIVVSLTGKIFRKTTADPKLLVGQRFSETVFWQSSENTPKILDRAIATTKSGEITKLLLDFRISADEKIAVELHIQLLFDEQLEPQLFIAGQEVESRTTRVENYKKESEQLLLAAENAEIGLWSWDFSENRIFSTPRCNELFEIAAYEELTYEGFLKVIHPDDKEVVREFLRKSLVDGTKYEEEFRVVYTNGTTEWVSAEGKTFLDDDNKPQRMMGVVRKTTEQKLAAEELTRVYDREKNARAEAVEANRAKDFFLAFVSHEIRSSLNAIIGWSKILLTKDVDDNTRRSALETIERSARSQTKLINDLVDSARVASGKLRLEYRPTNLADTVRGSFDAQKPAADAANLKYEFIADRPMIPVLGDSGRLHQVFGNLISNALKFTPEGGEVFVRVQTGDEMVTVTVSDNGKGIGPEALPNIFRQFSQGDLDHTNVNLGLGLGLSIVKILVERHGGVVSVQSEGIGKGAVFSVSLPLHTGSGGLPAVERTKATLSSRPLAGLSIFIVEDNVDSREVLQMFLEKSGASVMSAETAKTAFRILTENRDNLPDLIISDLAMPDEDGYSLIARIRRLPVEEGGIIPAIALSAFANDESRHRAFDAGFQRYATKPFDHGPLVNEILDLVGTKG
ncbi:MAG: ATP-binding protein [Blastocatellia bacterium]